MNPNCTGLIIWLAFTKLTCLLWNISNVKFPLRNTMTYSFILIFKRDYRTWTFGWNTALDFQWKYIVDGQIYKERSNIFWKLDSYDTEYIIFRLLIWKQELQRLKYMLYQHRKILLKKEWSYVENCGMLILRYRKFTYITFISVCICEHIFRSQTLKDKCDKYTFYMYFVGKYKIYFNEL